MAWVYGDSFQNFATADLTTRWTSKDDTAGFFTINATGGRRGGKCLRFGTSGGGFYGILKKTLTTSGAGFVVGFFWKTSVAPLLAAPARIAAIVQSGTVHLYLIVNTDFTVSVARGDGTVLGTSGATLLAAGVGGYIEFKGVIDNTTGSYTVRVNQTTVLTGTNKDTQNGGTAAWSEIWLGIMNSSVFSGATNVDWCDLYVLDQSGGGIYNDFLGDVRADYRQPTANGTTNNGTPSGAASQWDCVDETAPDGDTTKSTLAAAGDIDLFVMQDSPVAGATILCVQSVMYVKKSDAGTCTVQPIFRHSAANYVGTAVGPSTNYTYLTEGFVTNPGTGAAWVEADFNAIEAGVKKVT